MDDRKQHVDVPAIRDAVAGEERDDVGTQRELFELDRRDLVHEHRAIAVVQHEHEIVQILPVQLVEVDIRVGGSDIELPLPHRPRPLDEDRPERARASFELVELGVVAVGEARNSGDRGKVGGRGRELSNQQAQRRQSGAGEVRCVSEGRIGGVHVQHDSTGSEEAVQLSRKAVRSSARGDRQTCGA
jgi:hypothetical protein